MPGLLPALPFRAAGVGPRLSYVVEDVLGLTAGAAAPGGPMHEAFHGVVMVSGV